MKAKKILVVYNSIESGFARKERVFNKLVDELINEGRVVSSSSLTPNTKSVVFEDGSKVMVVPYATGLVGTRVTHLYIDDSIYELKNGEEYINEALKPIVIPSGNYQNLYAEESQENRIFMF